MLYFLKLPHNISFRLDLDLPDYLWPLGFLTKFLSIKSEKERNGITGLSAQEDVFLLCTSHCTSIYKKLCLSFNRTPFEFLVIYQ
jgi:hypothetical protein